MPIFETLPNKFKIEQNVLFSAKANINESGNFEESWLVIIEGKIMVYSSENEVLKEVLLSDITGVNFALGISSQS